MNLAQIALRAGEDAGLADRAAFLTSTGAVTNFEFRRQVFAIMKGLVELGVEPGDRVLLRMTNSVSFAASFVALVWLGAVPVLQNSQFGRSELDHIVGLAQPRGILYASNAVDAATKGLAENAWRAVVSSTGQLSRDGQFVVPGAADLDTPYDAQPDDPAFIVFTSGTTGRPKGIVHAHRWLEALGNSNRSRIPPQPNDVALATGEWSFVSALGHNVLFALRNGVPGSLLDERATPERILAAIERDRVTLLYSVATLYRRILGQPGIEKRFDLSSLRGANATGEPLEASVRTEWERRFGCPIWEHFGISEAQMVLGHGPLTAPREGTVGVAWGVKPAILDDDLARCAPGSAGRLAFEATYPGFFLGYLGDEAQSRETMRDGWFLTNDLASIDSEGYVSVLGRADDCFKSKGVLIVPREVEDALLNLGTIEEACVFGLPDQEIGHRIAAAIVPRSSVSRDMLDEHAVVSALDGSLAPFKCPHLVLVFDALPKNANGKTQRSAVKSEVLSRMTA